MRRHLLASAILFAVHTAHAADAPTLPTLQVQASQPSRIDSRVTVDNPQAQNRTLGGLLEHVSGVQNSAFGPNAGAPVIRSLSGNRVQILQDGQSILGMNAISGDINIPFDPCSCAASPSTSPRTPCAMAAMRSAAAWTSIRA